MAVDRVRVLVVNAGSSSLKLSLLDPGGGGRTDEIDPAAAERGLAEFLDGVGQPDAVGHRMVHGGPGFTGPVPVDDDVLRRIEDLRGLAPLHQGPALDALRHSRRALPDVPHVVSFDTAFHRTLPDAASTYAVPARWRDELGVRRYGFHGMAHEWAARRAAELTGLDLADLRVVTAHLGSGASLCAVEDGVSVDTTMGFTPTAGLVMGTRSGDLDPAVPSWLAGRGIDPATVADDLDRHSGLLGLAGSADPRDVLAAADHGDPDARIALDVWAHRVRAGIAAMTAAMGGLDVLVFSGGVGEHQPQMRESALERCAHLGLELGRDRNRAVRRGDAMVARGPVPIVVVTAREDVVIAEQVRSVVPPGVPGPAPSGPAG